MKPRDRPRFDIEALRELAGEKTFARGEVYHRDGQVAILSIEPERVLAQVDGTEDYRTELTGRGKDIDGECSCPAFEDWGFCKHMVAAALAANAAGNDAEVDGAGALDRIRDHLKKKGADALVEMIMEMAEQDPALFRRLDIAAVAVQGDEKTIEARLRKAIDSATHTGRYIDYREASGWAAGVGDALDAVSDLVAGGHPKLALKLIERAIDRIERVTESIDDSDGHCGALLDRACEIHVAAARMARPEPVQFARDLFARETQSDYDAFSGAVELYADVLGQAGLREYRRLASEAWEKLPPQSGARERRHEFFGNYHQLAGILDFFAERDGDVDARIALRAKNLSSPWSYLQLAEFCRSQGREEEALRRAEEGLWLFEDDRPDERLVFFMVHELPPAVRRTVIGEAARVLKPGGRLILIDSLQRGDEPDYDRMLESFPQHYHEPYYPSYVTEDFPAIARRCGLAHRRDTKAYVSKVMVFDKEAG